MVRVPVPDDYDSGHVSVAGVEDYHHGEADVNVDTPTARDVTVREDEDGRYVGVAEQHADAVADYLGVTLADTSEDEEDEDPDDEADAEDADEEEPDTCQVEKADGDVCGRERPCQYHD